VAALLEQGLAREDRAAQDGEHSVGALMPFVARFLRGTKVVALTVRRDVT
jgi:predicted class III extradiol MEMO1 family dioxygenase